MHALMELTILFLISSLGFLTIFKHLFTFTKWIFITFLRQPKDLKTYGSWAIITGSTDGIGKALAIQLAKQNLNLILISRNLKKLKAVSTEILQQLITPIQIKVIAMDFSSTDDVTRKIEEVIKGLEIGLLINCVGITYPVAMYFDKVDQEIWMNVVKVNLQSTSLVIKSVLSGMIERKRGVIVNIGSAAGSILPSHPLYAVYSATKAYIDKLSRSLHTECKDYGIHVQCQVPFYVATEMYKRVTSLDHSTPKVQTLFTPKANDYATAAIRQIGYEAKCTPYWTHSVLSAIFKVIPYSILDAWRLSVHRRRFHNSRLLGNNVSGLHES